MRSILVHTLHERILVCLTPLPKMRRLLSTHQLRSLRVLTSTLPNIKTFAYVMETSPPVKGPQQRRRQYIATHYITILKNKFNKRGQWYTYLFQQSWNPLAYTPLVVALTPRRRTPLNRPKTHSVPPPQTCPVQFHARCQSTAVNPKGSTQLQRS